MSNERVERLLEMLLAGEGCKVLDLAYVHGAPS
jgi:hypothetical protein